MKLYSTKHGGTVKEIFDADGSNVSFDKLTYLDTETGEYEQLVMPVQVNDSGTGLRKESGVYKAPLTVEFKHEKNSRWRFRHVELLNESIED